MPTWIISPTSSSTWGMNWIDSIGGPMEPGAVRTFYLPRDSVQGDNDSSWDGNWDLLARTCSGAEIPPQGNAQLVGDMFWELSD